MQHLLSAVGPNAKRGIRSQIIIHKAAIKKGRLVAEFTETLDNEQAGRDFAVTCGDHAHPDLLLAFRALVPHFCELTDQLPADNDLLADAAGVIDDPRLHSFDVTGVTYGGSREPGFTLVGTRRLASGHVMNLPAPFLTFDEVATSIHVLLDALNEEVELGLRGKCADAGRQLDMFTDQPDPTAALPGGAKRQSLLLGQSAEEVDEVSGNSSPDGGAGEELKDDAAATDGPEVPKKRGRGRPPKKE
jgi:hypothetical protein